MEDTAGFIEAHCPPFVVSVGRLVRKFWIANWWTPPLEYRGGKVVAKPHVDVLNGYFGKDDHYPYKPAFVLNDAAQMKRLRGAVANSLRGMACSNPFWREAGWYVVLAPDDGTLFGGSLADRIRAEYEAGGHRALVVPEGEPEDSILARLEAFAAEYRSCHEIDEAPVDLSGGLSDLALKCLACPFHHFRHLPQGVKDRVVDEIADEFATHEPLLDWNSVDEDFEAWASMAGSESIHLPCFVGNTMVNTFVRSRFDCHQKTGHKKTLNVVWKDRDLIRSVTAYELETSNGRYHSNRILAKMLFKHSYRIVSNLNQSYVYNRCRPYAVKGGIFYDPCAGWGGRMLAAYDLGMKYVAIDANRRLVGELNEMARYMGYDAEVTYGDSSDPECVKSVMGGRRASLSFSCPPYWKEEWYSDDPFQSYIKCKSKAEWYSGFLVPMLSNTLDATDGPFILTVDEKVELERASGFSFEPMAAPEGFNGTREDPYYFVSRR